MKHQLIEKKKFRFEELVNRISNNGTLFLQDLIDISIKDQLFTLFINHTVVIKDVVDLSFITYGIDDGKKEEDPFIHGIVDIYDRVQLERKYSSEKDPTKPIYIENDHVADIVVRSNIVINVLDLNVANFIKENCEESIALNNKFLIELYTDWHTQMHFKEQTYFQYFFE